MQSYFLNSLFFKMQIYYSSHIFANNNIYFTFETIFVCLMSIRAYHPTRHSNCRSFRRNRLVHQRHCSNHRILANLDVMACCYGCAHPDVRSIIDDNPIVVLFAPMTSEIHAIRDCNIVAYLYLVHAQVIQIALHSYKSPPPILNPHIRYNAIRTGVSTQLGAMF